MSSLLWLSWLVAAGRVSVGRLPLSHDLPPVVRFLAGIGHRLVTGAALAVVRSSAGQRRQVSAFSFRPIGQEFQRPEHRHAGRSGHGPVAQHQRRSRHPQIPQSGPLQSVASQSGEHPCPSFSLPNIPLISFFFFSWTQTTMDAASSSKRRSQGGDSKYGFAAAANGSIQRDALVSHSPRSHYNSAASGTPSRPGYAYSPSSRGQPPNGPNGNSTYGHNGVSPHPQQQRSPDSVRLEREKSPSTGAFHFAGR